MNLQGSHRCLEVPALQNYQENPEKRRQTGMLVIEAPWYTVSYKPLSLHPMQHLGKQQNTGTCGTTSLPVLIQSTPASPAQLHKAKTPDS